MKKLIVLFVFFSFSLFAQNGVIADDGWPRPLDCPYSVNSEHFVVHYNDELNDSSLADSILAYAEYSWLRQCNKFLRKKPLEDLGYWRPSSIA